VGGDKTRISTWELYSTSVPARQNSTEQQELILNFISLFNGRQPSVTQLEAPPSPSLVRWLKG